VAATSVYGMDHTGDDNHRDDGEPGHDVPVESGDRSHALLAELAEAERTRVRAEAHVSQLVVDIDQARTIEAGQHSDSGALVSAANVRAPKGRFAAPTRSGR